MTIQSAKQLLEIIRDGYSIDVVGGVIKISPAQCVDEQMAGLIRKYKAELLELLKSED